MSQAAKDITVYPWHIGLLKEWSIVGMNHYHANGEKFLFVSMQKGSKCITEEGEDCPHLWVNLLTKARVLNTPQ